MRPERLDGAQNVSMAPRTSERRELGCTVTTVGHAERRRLFGEDDALTAAKAAALVTEGITPVVLP